MLAALDIDILWPAIAAGLLVIATHVPLGQEVLRRGIIFADLAVAQIAGLGVIAAAGLGWEAHGLSVQLFAIGAALFGAWLLYVAELRWPQVQEAMIGALFVLAASGGVLLLANNPQAGEHLKELLVGQILWVQPQALAIVAVLSALVLIGWFGFGWCRQRFGFYLLFAASITASVQLVGVYLVFASLILPALATRSLTGRAALLWGYAIGAAGYVLGIALSAVLDWPTGAISVWTLALVSALAAVVGDRRA
ncbi:MAG: metal ABC transporter permease [Pseudomonadota bacterium]|nr:MAG: metal ABC transporter permease [Pseudomonadota bacterium]